MTVTAEDRIEDDAARRVYEAGYLILPTIQEGELEGVVARIRSVIEAGKGDFIAEGAPVTQKLAYTMYVNLGGKRVPYERAWFGWIKFEAAGTTANALRDAFGKDPSILRSIIFKTVREDTRAIARRENVLREVRRTDTIKSQPSKGAEGGKEVSEEALDKSLGALISE